MTHITRSLAAPFGPMDVELQDLQTRYSGGGQERVALRALVGR